MITFSISQPMLPPSSFINAPSEVLPTYTHISPFLLCVESNLLVSLCGVPHIPDFVNSVKLLCLALFFNIIFQQWSISPQSLLVESPRRRLSQESGHGSGTLSSGLRHRSPFFL